MKKSTKIRLITASSLILIGCIIFLGVMSVLNWDFKKLYADKYETNYHKITEKFSNISVDTKTADLEFLLSDNGDCKIECYEEKKAKHSVKVEEDTLIIKIENKKAWYEYIGINFKSPKIMVYLPNKEYSALTVNQSTGRLKLPEGFKFSSIDAKLSTGDVECLASATGLIKLKATTGKLSLKDSVAGAVELSATTGDITVSNLKCEGEFKTATSTGKVNLANLTCEKLVSTASTGNITLNKVIANDKLTIKRSTGDVKLSGSDAAEIFIKTSTGKVTGSLLTDKTFVTKTDTGRIDVPSSKTGGICEINTDTGNIKITIEK